MLYTIYIYIFGTFCADYIIKMKVASDFSP